MPSDHPTRYLDFDLEIGLGEGRAYKVTVRASPAGEALAVMQFPFDDLMRDLQLQKLQTALLRSGGQRRSAPSSEQRAVQDFGQALFDALFTGEVRNLYDVSQKLAANAEQGLRLKLRIQAPELAVLPWEYLFDKRAGEYMCLSRYTPIIRYLELPQVIQPLRAPRPLRILALIADPSDLQRLNVGKEKERVARALAPLQARGQVELTWLAGSTWRDLQSEMRGGPWHLFHFVGHGGFDRQNDEGLVVLTDDAGEAQPLLATQLARLLADQRALRLVVLNACEGARGSQQDIFASTAAILARRGVPAVLAMQHEITDRAAVEFARAFYDALAGGLPVDAAVSEGRKAVSLEVANTVEWGTPVLTMRASDGILFDVRATPADKARQAKLKRQQEAAERERQQRAADEAQQAALKRQEEAAEREHQVRAAEEARQAALKRQEEAAESERKARAAEEARQAALKRLQEAAESEREAQEVEEARQVELTRQQEAAERERQARAAEEARQAALKRQEDAAERERQARAAEEARQAALKRRGPIAFDWVEIPAGPFLMGSDKAKDPQAYDDELPQHTV
ncbi:MAG: CHAT domain-containing protein, partial [Anaerolineae bacterium]